MISLCMIVKNEAENLRECLKSAEALVEEIIIVDTGSIDNSKEIAAEFTDKIFDFNWCEDFSKARNFSISKASNDWILVLDADEIVESYDVNKIHDLILHNEKIIGRLRRVNSFEDSKGTKKHIERITRLFNKKYYKYDGIIHEQVVQVDNSHMISSSNIELSVNHVGYSKEVVCRTNKIQRNIELLLKAYDENNKEPYICYQLGKSYFMGRDYLQACNYFQLALKQNVNFNLEYVEDLIESYGYAMLNSKKNKEALIIKNYEIYYNSSPDFNFVMGLINMNNTLFNEAIAYFQKCIGSKEGSVEGVNSFLPNYNIGVIYECLGYIDESLKYYNESKTYKLSKDRLDIILRKHSN